MNQLTQSVAYLKKLIDNKKIRLIVILVMYITAFGLISYIAYTNILANKNKLSPYVEEYGKLDNYSYSYTIKSLDKNDKLTITSVSGKRYIDKQIMHYDGKYYSVIDDEIKDFPITAFDINKLDNSDIYKYLQIATMTKSSNCLDVYQISLSKFIKLVDNKQQAINGYVTISLVKIDKKLVQVDLNLTNYVKNKSDLYNYFAITINYNQINEIIDF